LFPALAGETPLRPRDHRQCMVQVDPVLVGIIAFILLVILVIFLMIRRTLTAFTEGLREGNQR
jgi:hypothetical protein